MFYTQNTKPTVHKMTDYGIASLSLIPVRLKPAHNSEMVSQLLYGETYTVTEYQDDWLRIEMHYDNYIGFIPKSLHTHITKQWFHHIENAKNWYAGEIVQMVTNHNTTFPILIGSSLHEFDGLNYKIGKEQLVYAGNVIPESDDFRQFEFIKKISKKFLNAPYQWGGRSPFGIDCSGFVQVVFKLCSIRLPRDAYQQAEHGRTINFIYEALPGDLCFFDNTQGKIIHVGILYPDQKIMHASGKVRIDTIDHFGIFNSDQKKYTHKLRIIKRLL